MRGIGYDYEDGHGHGRGDGQGHGHRGTSYVKDHQKRGIAPFATMVGHGSPRTLRRATCTAKKSVS